MLCNVKQIEMFLLNLIFHFYLIFLIGVTSLNHESRPLILWTYIRHLTEKKYLSQKDIDEDNFSNLNRGLNLFSFCPVWSQKNCDNKTFYFEATFSKNLIRFWQKIIIARKAKYRMNKRTQHYKLIQGFRVTCFSFSSV